MGGNLCSDSANLMQALVLMQFYLNSLFYLEISLSHTSQSALLLCSLLSINTCMNLLSVQTCLHVLSWANSLFVFSTTISGIPCTNHTFKCRNNNCIRKQNAKCDGTVDCIDGSDESSCSKSLSNVHLFELWTFYTIKPFISSCFGVGTTHAVGIEVFIASSQW